MAEKIEDPHFFKNYLGGEYNRVTDANFEARKSPDPILRDHYSHFSNELRTAIKEQTQLGLTSLMAQATVTAAVGSWLFSQKDFLGNPPGKSFSIQTAPNEFYTTPDVFGGVKSILRFVDGIYGDSYSSGEPIQSILKNMAEANMNDANPLLRLVLDSASRKTFYTYDIHCYIVCLYPLDYINNMIGGLGSDLITAGAYMDGGGIGEEEQVLGGDLSVSQPETPMLRRMSPRDINRLYNNG